MKSPSIVGLVAATHTPFHEDGSLAPEVVDLQAAHLARNGVETVFITGSTGESLSLTRDERLQIFRAWSEAGPKHGVRVIAHVGSNCIEDSKAFARTAGELGLSAISSFSPSYYKPANLEALVAWCAAVADAAPQTPFYYYDIPSMTGVNFSMYEFLQLAGDKIPSLVGIKFTNPDLAEYKRCRELEQYDIPWGIDEKLILALQAGAVGGVGSSYNFAAYIYQDLIAAYRRGDMAQAQALQDQSIALIHTLAKIGYLGAAKAIMGWQGVPVGPARLPNGNPSEQQLEELRSQLEPRLVQA